MSLESERKALQQTVQQLQARSNQLAQEVALARKTNAVAEHGLLAESHSVKSELQKNLSAFQIVKEQLDKVLLRLPNLPDLSVPIGRSCEDNVTVRSWGELPTFNFNVKDHVRLSAGMYRAMDFEQGSLIAGSRFVVLWGMLARLHRVLTQWMLTLHTEEHGYVEVAVPYIVNRDSLTATGQLPSFEKDLFKLQVKNEWYLTPTAEVPLTNLGRGRIFEERDLPTKYVAYTPCFRSEAGSYGKDVKGMIRQHQFDKVELVQFVKPEEGLHRLELLTETVEVVLKRLELPYRVVSLCTGDLGFGAAKTYDVEVWLPGKAGFVEISSCSYMGDFQARRLKARWRSLATKELSLLHTLNGSGLAVGRTLVAILENYQQEDGSVKVPSVLKPYMGGLSIIPPLN